MGVVKESLVTVEKNANIVHCKNSVLSPDSILDDTFFAVMKKIIVTILLLAALAVVVTVTLGWIRLQGLQTEASTTFQTLTDFYVSMDTDHVSKVQALPSLGPSDQSSIAEYRAAIAAVQTDVSLWERIKFLRTAQGVGSGFFATASGSLVSDPDYVQWHTDSANSGMVFPHILAYNQAAQSLNDDIAAWPGTMLARFLKVEPLILLDVDGREFEQRPSRI